MGIVANKSDLFDKQEVNENDVMQFAEEKKVFLIETSACKGIGIDTLFEEIGNRIMDQIFKAQKENANRNSKIDDNKTNNIDKNIDDNIDNNININDKNNDNFNNEKKMHKTNSFQIKKKERKKEKHKHKIIKYC